MSIAYAGKYSIDRRIERALLWKRDYARMKLIGSSQVLRGLVMCFVHVRRRRRMSE
jgi:hypothetical protein